MFLTSFDETVRADSRHRQGRDRRDYRRREDQ